jgi:peptide deformylase
MINPEITKFSDQIQVTEEGCLSIPELYYEVERPDAVTVQYTDLDGKEVVRDADGKLAVCIQHEIDHLDGVLYIDYLSRLKRHRVIKKFDKAAKRAAG